MKGRWPDKFTVKAEKIGKDKWKLNYIERFENAPKIGDTILVLKEGLKNLGKTFDSSKWKIRCLKDGISLSIEGSREDIYDMLVAEFSPLSRSGKRSFAEILIRMAVMLRMSALKEKKKARKGKK